MISYVLHEEHANNYARATGQRRASGENEEMDGIECEDAPTVVIDDSIDDQQVLPAFPG
jgi:hypothetical protein